MALALRAWLPGRIAIRNRAQRAAQRWLATVGGASSVGQDAAAAGAKAAGGVDGTEIVRTNVGIFGAMNAGKSTLMNVLTQNATSIVDATAGTTTDPKIATHEIHEVGPCKLFDTPGADEDTELGRKKRERALEVMKRCDVSLVVVSAADAARSVRVARDMLAAARAMPHGPKTLVLLNTHGQSPETMGEAAFNSMVDAMERDLGLSDAASGALAKDMEPLLVLDLHGQDAEQRVTSFVARFVRTYASPVELLPRLRNADRTGDVVVFLNVPMDEETPSGRLLRPQAWAQEALLRRYISSYVYRMDLRAARGDDRAAAAVEETRFRAAVDALRGNGPGATRPSAAPGLALLITDSQAMDCVHPWTLDEAGRPTVPVTTFSVMMANFVSGGRLPKFVEGLNVLSDISRRGSRAKALICEACNHDRIADDIGTVQIPRHLTRHFGDRISLDWSFGREYATKNLRDYDVVIHCGGCMLDQQRMRARLADIESTGVPITNYGLILSWVQSPLALERVLEPWTW